MNPNMLRVGLTGGMGSGKSTVASFFGVLGIPVFYADVQAKQLMEHDPALRAAISERFGERMYGTGGLDRAALAAEVFKDAQALAVLNALVHPAVREAFERWVMEHEAAYVLMEAALMVENQGYERFDKVITVSCPEELRVQRVIGRDQVTEAAVRERLQHQASDEQRERIADFVVKNDGSTLVIPQVLDIHAQLLKLAGS